LVEQMGRGVVSPRRVAGLAVNRRGHAVPDRERARLDAADVEREALAPLRVAHGDLRRRRGPQRLERAAVARLAAALRVERRSVEHRGHVVARRGAFDEAVSDDEADDRALALAARPLVAEELRGLAAPRLDLAERPGVEDVARHLRRRARAGPLDLELLV